MIQFARRIDLPADGHKKLSQTCLNGEKTVEGKGNLNQKRRSGECGMMGEIFSYLNGNGETEGRRD